LVTGLGSGAYSEKLEAGTKRRLSRLSHPRQCGEDVLRILVIGAPPNFGGGGIPSDLVAHNRRFLVWEYAWHARQIYDAIFRDVEEATDRKHPDFW
jgi:hypothetical protein